MEVNLCCRSFGEGVKPWQVSTPHAHHVGTWASLRRVVGPGGTGRGCGPLPLPLGRLPGCRLADSQLWKSGRPVGSDGRVASGWAVCLSAPEQGPAWHNPLGGCGLHRACVWLRSLCCSVSRACVCPPRPPHPLQPWNSANALSLIKIAVHLISHFVLMLLPSGPRLEGASHSWGCPYSLGLKAVRLCSLASAQPWDHLFFREPCAFSE